MYNRQPMPGNRTFDMQLPNGWDPSTAFGGVAPRQQPQQATPDLSALLASLFQGGGSGGMGASPSMGGSEWASGPGVGNIAPGQSPMETGMFNGRPIQSMPLPSPVMGGGVTPGRDMGPSMGGRAGADPMRGFLDGLMRGSPSMGRGPSMGASPSLGGRDPWSAPMPSMGPSPAPQPWGEQVTDVGAGMGGRPRKQTLGDLGRGRRGW